MRQIKFRVWDDGEMHYVTQLNIYGEEYEVDLCDTDGNQEYFGLIVKGEELMQYAGLKDKNGVEIYEGDILKYSNTTTRFNKTLAHEVVGRVLIEKGMTYLMGELTQVFDGEIKVRDYREFLFSPEIFIIIGNIHENPELGGII